MRFEDSKPRKWWSWKDLMEFHCHDVSPGDAMAWVDIAVSVYDAVAITKGRILADNLVKVMEDAD